MKKTFVALTMLMTVVTGSAFAEPFDPANEQAKETFRKEFPGASIISWSTAGEMTKAVFIYGGYRSEAYFNEDGELKGSARNIFYSQVPLAVTRSVEKRFEQPEVLEVTEITMGSGTSYVIRLSSGTKSYQLQIDAGGNLIQKEKTRD